MEDSSSESSSSSSPDHEDIPIFQLLKERKQATGSKESFENSALRNDSSSEEDILLSKEEHDEIRNFEPSLSFIKTRIDVVDIVTKQAISLLSPLIYQFEVCIMRRIPPLFQMLRKCFDFSERFQILSEGKFEEYLNYNIESLSQLANMENEYLKQDNMSSLFDYTTLRRESRSVLTKLALVYQKKERYV